MNELTPIITRVPGALTWDNYTEIEAELDRVLSDYKGIAYTEDTVKEAKADRATLNKLKKAIDEARIRTQKIWMEPYDNIRDKAKALTERIDSQIAEIDISLKAFEADRREKAKAEIMAYIDSTIEDLPEAVRKTFIRNVYSPSWENASAKKREWRNAIDSKADSIRVDLKTLTNIAEPDFYEDAEKVYASDYSLGAALDENLRLVREMERLKETIKAKEEKEAEEIIPEDDSLDSLLDMFKDDPVEPVKEQKKVLCIHGKGDYMRELHDKAIELGLDAWYQLM